MAGDRTYRDRIDPGGEFGRQIEGMAALVQSPLRYLLRARGLEEQTLNEPLALRANYERLTTEPDRIAAALAPLGWVFSSDSPLDDYSAAATLVEEGRSEEAEDVLTERWNENEWSLLRPVLRVKMLYWETRNVRVSPRPEPFPTSGRLVPARQPISIPSQGKGEATDRPG